nr:immunoglobulin light chain junction region [Macaca mulatta]MPN91879.1 immunoglobulin light chain junction region [Macaca mulatta]MPN92319.1 immunoglobulin light chain junction region [Macaca mulatta]MPN93865.1 immunoglobulin light chain junction region [Macaca mulatta]MPN94479.1 immunoglobulin light chain junction region [Macaca mulatta]
CQQESNWPTC